MEGTPGVKCDVWSVLHHTVPSPPLPSPLGHRRHTEGGGARTG